MVQLLEINKQKDIYSFKKIKTLHLKSKDKKDKMKEKTGKNILYSDFCNKIYSPRKKILSLFSFHARLMGQLIYLTELRTECIYKHKD